LKEEGVINLSMKKRDKQQGYMGEAGILGREFFKKGVDTLSTGKKRLCSKRMDDFSGDGQNNWGRG